MPSACTLPCSLLLPDVKVACIMPCTMVSMQISCSMSMHLLMCMRGVWQEGELKATGRQPGGVLTAAAALGMPLVQRLRNAGFTLEIKE